ncbi:hypothetical protein ACJMK2_024618 [Sinanodonta woodiana]|uniref:Uncharacterized protein n=1 Tax=Sinanodonta woodiana TaxID=1069815 RepID=A0ABD3XED3_SINWO
MASRSSEQTSVPYDLDNSFNWTTHHLKRKLESIGIKVSYVLPNHALRQLYMDNALSTSSRPADHVQRQSMDSSPPQAELSLRPMEEVASPLPQLPTRRGRRSATIVNAHSAQIYNPAETAIQRTFPEVRVTSHMAIMTQHASSSEFSLNDSTLVSTSQASQPMMSLHQLIRFSRCKHVNLATLLQPHFELDISNLDNKATKYDPRLLRHLRISEFITAFGKYKRIISSTTRIGYYEADIIKISNAYEDIFFDYHNVYSTQAAIALRDYKVKVNWAIRDQATLQLLFGGRISKSLDICNSVSHSTDFCPQTRQTSTPIVNLANRRKIDIDKYGRPRQIMDGKELYNICNSIRGCHRTTCQVLHTCNQCRANSHGATACSHITHKHFFSTDTRDINATSKSEPDKIKQI